MSIAHGLEDSEMELSEMTDAQIFVLMRKSMSPYLVRIVDVVAQLKSQLVIDSATPNGNTKTCPLILIKEKIKEKDIDSAAFVAEMILAPPLIPRIVPRIAGAFRVGLVAQTSSR